MHGLWKFSHIRVLYDAGKSLVMLAILCTPTLTQSTPHTDDVHQCKWPTHCFCLDQGLKVAGALFPRSHSKTHVVGRPEILLSFGNVVWHAHDNPQVEKLQLESSSIWSTPKHSGALHLEKTMCLDCIKERLPDRVRREGMHKIRAAIVLYCCFVYCWKHPLHFALVPPCAHTLAHTHTCTRAHTHTHTHAHTHIHTTHTHIHTHTHTHTLQTHTHTQWHAHTLTTNTHTCRAILAWRGGRICWILPAAASVSIRGRWGRVTGRGWRMRMGRSRSLWIVRTPNKWRPCMHPVWCHIFLFQMSVPTVDTWLQFTATPSLSMRSSRSVFF